MTKILNLKLVILLDNQNINIFLQTVMFKIDLKKFLLLQKLKTLCRGQMLLVTLKARKLLESFRKKNKTNQKEFRVGKVIKKKDDKLTIC